MYRTKIRSGWIFTRTVIDGLVSGIGDKFRRIPVPGRGKLLLILVFILALLGISILSYHALKQPLSDYYAFVKDQEAVNAHFQGYGLWGPILLAFYQLLQVIIAIIPGHALMVAGGYVFGMPLGFAINYLSVVLASQLAFGVARLAGQPVVNRLVPSESLGKWTEVTRRHGTTFLIVSFILPGFPDDVMNFVAGMSPISGRQFLLANAVGRLPSAVLLTLIGSHGFQLPLTVWIGLVPAIGLLFLGYRYFYRHHLAPQWNLEPAAAPGVNSGP